MKLHLPNGLRKALLACLAALALPVTLPTTVATASGIAAAWFVAAQRADADVSDYPTIFNTNDYKAAAGDATKNTSSETWTLNVNDSVEDYSFWFQGSPGAQGALDSRTDANLWFERTLRVNNGNRNHTQTFSGNISGREGANLVFAWAAHADSWTFFGDLSGFGGDIRSTSGTVNIAFLGGAKSNRYAIKQDGGTINLSVGNATIVSREVNVNTLTATEEGTANFNKYDSSWANTTVQANELQVNDHGELNFNDRANVTVSGKVILNANYDKKNDLGIAALTMNGGTLTAEAVELKGDARVTLDVGARLDWFDYAPNGHTLTLRLEETLSDAEIGLYGTGNYGYDVFGKRWKGGNIGIVLEAESESGRKLMVESSGKVVYDNKEPIPQLKWTSQPTNNELDWVAGAWDDGVSFGDRTNADVFITGGGGTIMIDADEVRVVHVSFDGSGGNNEFNLEYAGDRSACTLSVGGIIYVGGDNTVRVGQKVTVKVGRYTGAGELSLDGGAFEVLVDTNPIVETLSVTEQGGTLRVRGGVVSGVDTSVTLNAVEGAEGALRVEGRDGSATVKFANGGALRSFTQEGVQDVNIGLSGHLTLHEGGLAYGLFTFEENDSDLTLGGDFTTGKGLSHVVPEEYNVVNRDGSSELGAELGTLTYTISSNAAGPVTLTIGKGKNGSGDSLMGNLTVGDGHHQVDIVKTGSGMQTFGEGAVEIWGNVTIEDNGILCFKDTRLWKDEKTGTLITKESYLPQPDDSTDATTRKEEHAGRRSVSYYKSDTEDVYYRQGSVQKEYKVEIHGALSGDGCLYVMDSTVTLSGPAGQIGVLRFSNGDKGNVLELGNDLTVGEIGYCGYANPSNMVTDGAGTIRKAEGVPSGRTLYLLLNPVDAGLITMDEFLDRYHTREEDHVVGTDKDGKEWSVPRGVTLGEGIGIGKGGEGELQMRAGSEPVTQPFKLAGSGTLLWVEGTQEIEDFTGETRVTESTDETNPEPEIIGPTLKMTGGTLRLQKVSGTLKMVDLDARAVGRLVLSLGGGTLRAYTLKGAPGAALELQLSEQDNTAGWLDIQDIVADGGPFGIRLSGAKLERVQLFSRRSEMWTGHLKELLLGEGGTGYAWTDLFRIEMDSALLEQWGVTNINELRFQITDEGVLKIETTAGYLLWNGSEEDVWSPTQTSGWENNMNNPEGQHVRFTKDSGSSIVNIGGARPVSPKNVDVESGRFVFQNAPGTDTGGLKMLRDEEGNGVLHIFEEAELHLNLRNTSIPLVNLEGVLGLGHPEALPEGTHLQFNGGMLLYDTDGVTPDVSNLVDRDSSGPVRVAVDVKGSGVTWGRNNTAIGDNRGLSIALNGKGLEKSGGRGNFTLAWLDDGAEHKAGLTVTEGSLTLDVGGEESANMSGNITGAGTLVVGGSSKVTLSGNNTVKGIVLGGGTSTHLKGKTALGGAETVLTLAGGTLTGDNGAEAQAGTVKVDADTTVSVVTLTGAVTGSGALRVEDGKTAGLAGDLSGYAGELETGKSGTWKLSGGALEKPFNAAVSGNGTVQFDGGGTFGGEVKKGSVTLRGNGERELTVVTRETEARGAILAGTVALGNASAQARWCDTALAENSTIYLSNVVLQAQPTKSAGTKLYVRTAASKTRPAEDIVVDVYRMDASNLDGITINGHGQLKNITGTYTANGAHGLELHFARENVEDGGVSGGTAEPAANLLAAGGETKALIEGQAGFTLESKDDTGRKICLDSDAVSEILTIMAKAKEEGQKATAILHLLEQGTLTMKGLTMDDLLGDEVQILRSLDTEFEVDEANGNLVLKGSAADVFVAFAGKSELDNGTFLDQAKATVLSDETTDFTLNLDGATRAGEEPDVTVHNLLGLTGSILHLQNSNADAGANRLVVAFDNTQVDKIKDPSKYPTVEDTTVYGQHTTYNGSIDAGNGVDVTKVGYGTLTVGGTYMLADGTTTIREGALRLRGESNAMEGLTFDYTEDAQQTGLGEEYRGLLLEDGTTTVRGAISDEGEVGKGDIKLSNAELILNGQSTLEGTSITSEDGTGKLTLKKAEGAAEGTPDPSLTLSGEKVRAVLSGVDVDVQAGLLKLQKGATMTGGSAKIGDTGTLDLGDSAGHELSSLEGSGVLKSAFGGKVRVGGDSSFSGKLGSSEEGGKAGTLEVVAGANFTLSNVTTTATNTANGWGITVEGTGPDGTPGGNLTIDVSGKAAGEQLTLGAVSLGSGSTTTIQLSTETYNAEGKSTIVGSSLSFADDVSIVLEAVDGEAWDYNRDLTLGTYDEVNGNLDELAEDGIKLKGAAFFRTGVKDVVVGKDGKVTVLFQATAGIELNGAGGKNANAGATLVNGSYENEQKKDLVLHSNTDYARVMNYFINHQDGAVNEQRPLSAFAGASVSILGPALSEDLHRQLGSIRNRTTTMANEVTQEAVGQLPLWHAWINGEGNYHKMDEDSLAPGYTLNSWGGTVGADADLTPHVTVGLAITAMYGDLDADAPDTATGDMDTSYLSAFVRATRGAWIHTFVVSGGIANVKLNRTVNFGGDSYTTHGDTDGYAFGAMYEVGYTGLVNKRGTAALQPVFNVEVRHVAIDGYAETGSDAGVDVDDIDRTVVTFGAGVRAQAAVATNAFNRTSVLESRLLLKLDVGDRSGTASNAIVGDKTRAEVESAEVGEFGVEFGLGISVPLGSDLGSVFLDGSVEYREGWTSANATLGYRITF